MELKPLITSHIDWLTKSYHATLTPIDVIPQIGGLKVENFIGKVRQYSHGYTLKCGGFLLCNRDDRQGSLLDLSGDPVKYLREIDGLDDSKLLKIITEYSEIGRGTTRIDYCWNIYSGDINPKLCLDEWSQKRCTMNFKKKPRIYAEMNSDTGELDPVGMTVIFGSDKAPNQVKVYDKSAEMKIAGEALNQVLGGITRVEMRIRAEYAKMLVADMKKHGIQKASQSKLKNLLDFPSLDWYQDIFQYEHVELSKMKPKDTQALKFLVKTVNPFIEKNIHDPQFAEQLLSYISSWANTIARDVDLT